MGLGNASLLRCRSGWNTVISWSISERITRTGWSLYVSPNFHPDVPFLIAPGYQLYGAVEGLRYLHEANLTHGDLKGVRNWISPEVSLFLITH